MAESKGRPACLLKFHLSLSLYLYLSIMYFFFLYPFINQTYIKTLLYIKHWAKFQRKRKIVTRSQDLCTHTVKFGRDW